MEPKTDQLGNYAFIDSQNLNLSIREMGWPLDHKRFRAYLEENYNVVKAYIFVGFIEGHEDLYNTLEAAGFECIYKPTIEHKDGTTKGNCDAELVLQAMIDYDKYDKAVVISGDGDFQCLVKYFIEQDKLLKLIIPNRNKYSALYKEDMFEPYLHFMNNLKSTLAYKKHRPKAKAKKGEDAKEKTVEEKPKDDQDPLAVLHDEIEKYFDW